MAINARNQLDQTSLAMKQVSLVRMLVQAKALQERGQLKKAPVPAGYSRPAVRQLRIKAVEA